MTVPCEIGGGVLRCVSVIRKSRLIQGCHDCSTMRNPRKTGAFFLGFLSLPGAALDWGVSAWQRSFLAGDRPNNGRGLEAVGETLPLATVLASLQELANQ